MSRRHTQLLQTALSALHYSGAGRLLAPLTRGRGVIFTMHHVTPEPAADFEPNRILKITPAFLDAVLAHVRAQGFDIVSLDEAAERTVSAEPARPFACFTLDDGYRDNRDFAYPVFKRHEAPFTIYVPTDFADGTGDLWWLTLEAIVASADAIDLVMDGAPRRFETETTAAKYAAFHAIYWWLRRRPEDDAREIVASLAFQHAVSTRARPDRLLMDWDEIRRLAADPLVTIGAHTRRHYALAKLPEAEAREEMAASIQRIEAELGRPCQHFSYPYGDEESAGEREFRLARELGCRTGVTTRKGLIPADGSRDLFGLPRLSLNGDYQDLRHLDVILSGVPFALWNAAQRLRPPKAAA